jgi:3-hydroxyacyl-CoA dehydrogenase/enoyl-CoA hydratase/3-hydroxybutyryl-CoA epimerase
MEANPEAKQPWDESGYRMPGGNPNSPKLAPILAGAPAMLRQKTKGVFPAPEAILSAMVEGALLSFEAACRVESRYFVQLVCSPVAKNMINTFWYQLNEVKAGVGRPAEIPLSKVNKVGVLGAGMMGAGIAYVSARRGVDVVLKDVSVERAEAGKSYSAKLLAKRVKRGAMTQVDADAILARIETTAEAETLQGCDLVIEAVFESRELKARVTAEAEAQLEPDAIFASNTSTLPISGLAAASCRPERFIGLHFFSPVDKMQLVEIICGRETSPETLARAYDFVTQLGKMPIVVQDSRGFFTSRVFGTYTNEGIAMVGEGVPPAMIESAAQLCGFPVGPLAVSDEVSLTLMEKIRAQTAADCVAEGLEQPHREADPVIDEMLALGRAGKAAGAGFYEYPPDAKKRLWQGLQERFSGSREGSGGRADMPLTDVKDRLLYIMALETARCLSEGVLSRAGDANIGSIFGIGFPAWTGGATQFIKHVGVERFERRAAELASRYGERFDPQRGINELSSLIER